MEDEEKRVSAMRGCVVPGCLELSKWNPCVKVILPGNDIPFALDFSNLAICDTHKERFVLSDVVTPDRLKQIQLLFKYTNLTEPTLEGMTLTWVGESFVSSIAIQDTNGKNLGTLTDIRHKDLGVKV
jgi:hypothetical protein